MFDDVNKKNKILGTQHTHAWQDSTLEEKTGLGHILCNMIMIGSVYILTMDIIL